MRPDGIDSAVRSLRSPRRDGLSRRKLVAAFAAFPVVGAIDLPTGHDSVLAGPDVVIVGSGPIAEAATANLASFGLDAKLYRATGADGRHAGVHWLGEPLALPGGFADAAVSARRARFPLQIAPGNTLLRVRPSGSGYLLEFRADDDATVFVRADLLGLALSPEALRSVRFDVPLPPALTRAARATATDI